MDQSTKRIFEAEKLQSEQKELFGPRGSQANRSKDFFLSLGLLEDTTRCEVLCQHALVQDYTHIPVHVHVPQLPSFQSQ